MGFSFSLFVQLRQNELSFILLSSGFRTQYEDYFIGRLESPCHYCEDLYVNRKDENCSTLEETPINIINPKDGKMLGIDYEDDDIDAGDDDLIVKKPMYTGELTWFYKPTCDGKVTLTNELTESSLNVTYDVNLKTIMNEDGLFALNSKKGFKWVSEIKYLKPELVTPWKRYQWDIVRLPASRAQF